jgi:hypothetical protein
MKAKDAAARGGFVAAACVACCAPPMIGALGVTAGIAATAGVFLDVAAFAAAFGVLHLAEALYGLRADEVTLAILALVIAGLDLTAALLASRLEEDPVMSAAATE